MRCNTFVFLLGTGVLGWNEQTIKMSLDYFQENIVKFVCLLTCSQDRWIIDFVKKASNRSIAISSVNVRSIDDSKLASCLRQPITTIGVMINPDCAGFREIMHYASENTLLNANHKWLIIKDKTLIDDVTEISDPNAIKESISLDNLTKENNENETETTGTEVGSISLFENSQKKKNGEIAKILQVLEDLDTSVDADITMARQIGTDDFDLREVFNFGKTKGGKFVMSELGNWNSQTGLQIPKGFKYYRRWNFQNVTLRMIIVMTVYPKTFDPQTVIGRKAGRGVNVITQISAIALNEIAKIHNIRYTYKITDQWIGLYQRNATRVVSNSLYYGEADISPVIRMSKTHFKYFDILHPSTTSLETKYYYRILSYGPGKFENQFLRPLSREAWWSVMAMLFACGVVLLLSAIVERHPTSAQYALFSVIATFCQQFFEDVEKSEAEKPSTSGKLTVLVTGVFCVLIYNYYTSSVVSWLLNGPPPSINSLWELLESPLKLVYEDIGYSLTWIKLLDYYFTKRNAEVEIEMKRRKVWNKKKGEPLVVPLNQGIEMIRSGEYAFHMEVNTANKLIALNFDQRELCELGSLYSMEPTLLYPSVQKNSPYREFYIWSLSRLSERGLISCIEKQFLSPPVVCEGSSPRALALGGAAPAFILLSFGYIASVIIMLVERLVHRKEIPYLE